MYRTLPVLILGLLIGSTVLASTIQPAMTMRAMRPGMMGAMQPAMTANALAAPPLTAAPEVRFAYLSAHGNSSCSQAFTNSISSMTAMQRLEGSCCSPMDMARYKQQIGALTAYRSVPQIPGDPYDVPAPLARQLLTFDRTITPTPAEQKVLNAALAKTQEHGYCCCACWRWSVYEGLSRYLVHERHFTATQITAVLNDSDGCGGAS